MLVPECCSGTMRRSTRLLFCDNKFNNTRSTEVHQDTLMTLSNTKMACKSASWMKQGEVMVLGFHRLWGAVHKFLAYSFLRKPT